MNEALRQLRVSGYAVFLQHLYCDGDNCVRGTVKPELLAILERRLREDIDHGLSGPWHALHADVGDDRFEWRSFRNTYGPGSLQIVLGRDTGRVYADTDRFSPYDDLVGIGGHAGEVIGPRLKRLWKRTGLPLLAWLIRRKRRGEEPQA